MRSIGRRLVCAVGVLCVLVLFQSVVLFRSFQVQLLRPADTAEDESGVSVVRSPVEPQPFPYKDIANQTQTSYPKMIRPGSPLPASGVVVPIPLYGFNNQLQSVYHGLVLAKALKRAMVLPVFFPHYTALQKNDSQIDGFPKRSYSFDHLFQWTWYAKRLGVTIVQDLASSVSTCSIVSKDCPQTTVAAVLLTNRRNLTSVEPYIQRLQNELGVTFKFQFKVFLENIPKKTSQLSAVFNQLLFPKEIVVLSAFFQSAYDFQYQRSNDKFFQDIVRSFRPSDLWMKIVRDFTERAFSSMCYVSMHLRPFPDECLFVWGKVPPDSDSFKSYCKPEDFTPGVVASKFIGFQDICSKEHSHLVPFFVAHPPLLSTESFSFLANQAEFQGLNLINMRVILHQNPSLASSVPVIDDFLMSFFEQVICLGSVHFFESRWSTWSFHVSLWKSLKV